MTSRHSIDNLEMLAEYLKEGINNRQSTLQRDRINLDAYGVARIDGELYAFSKVL